VLADLAGLAVGYGDRTLFDRLDLVLRSGTWTVVTGPSGSGVDPDLSHRRAATAAGRDPVTVADGPWDGLSRGARAEHRRRWLALLPQRPAMLEALTVRENLQLTVGIRGYAGEQPDTTVDELAERLALSRLLDQPVQLLSGGERQRAALARTLISSAPLLLLDEPTSQQDESSSIGSSGCWRGSGRAFGPDRLARPASRLGCDHRARARSGPHRARPTALTSS
jgi:ABC-type lipoprotein export system ATPase subunit